MADSEFDGFANQGDTLSLEVATYAEQNPDNEAVQAREKSQRTESSIVAFRTNDPSTNGAPAAVVGRDYSERPEVEGIDLDNYIGPDDDTENLPPADLAEGEEGKGS